MPLLPSFSCSTHPTSEFTTPSHKLFSADSKTSLAFTPLIVSYTIEILPYPLRAKGFNVFNFVISLALIFNQYVNPIALEALKWKYYVRFLSLILSLDVN